MNNHSKINIYIAFILLFLGSVSSCKKQNPRLFTLRGTIENLKDKNILFVRDYRDSVVVDTIHTNSKGDFKLDGIADTLMLGTLFFNEGRSSTSVFIDKGWDVKVEGDANLPDLIEVKGGDVNNDLSEFKKDNRANLESRGAMLDKMRKKFSPNVHPPKPSPDITSKLANLDFQLTNSAAEYIRKNPDKIASVILIQDFFRDDTSTDQLDKKIQSLKEPAASFILTQQLRQYITQTKASQEGAIAPFFQLKDAKGTDVRLYDFRSKYLLLSFVCNDCELCIKNGTELEKIYKKFKDKPLEIVSILITSHGQKKEAEKNSATKVEWKVIPLKESWASQIVSDYNIRELPLNLLIDMEGKIVAREVSPVTINEKLEKLLH
jgi:peroxiredoxin